MNRRHSLGLIAVLCGWLSLTGGCMPSFYRREADKVATSIIEHEQQEVLGRDEPFTIERPVDTLRRRLMLEQNLPRSSEASLGTDQLTQIEHWPEKDYPAKSGELPGDESSDVSGAVTLTLVDALKVAALNSRDYQSRKEDVYRAALDLDLESDEFRNTFAGVISATQTHNLADDATIRGNRYTAAFDWRKKLTFGAELTAGLALDLVKLLTADRDSSFGILADATITIPLMRGAGRHIVTEPLTQSQRDVVYSLYTLERFKRTLAVRVASDYLAVLRQRDTVDNERDNYARLIEGTERIRRLSEAGRLPEIQVDQARQDALRARDRWIAARLAYTQRLDQFKITLGLPTDAVIELDRAELERLAEAARERVVGDGERLAAEAAEEAAAGPIELIDGPQETGGPLELPPEEAVGIALSHRLDLQTAEGRVFDAQRRVVVAANALEMGLSVTGSAQAGERRSLGSASAPAARLRPRDGLYAFGVELDLPLERTAEQNAYRNSYINLERSVRDVQDLEDQIKLQVRGELRDLVRGRESYRIQSMSVTVAQRRVESTALFLQAGRAQVRDVLEAQEAFVSAQNALTSALVNYRVAELELQRDLGVLQIDSQGLWHEYTPDDAVDR
ncbi:MAG: TolC family protein [Planctomycetota bacterium]|jgi:outer membrane protein TolC